MQRRIDQKSQRVFEPQYESIKKVSATGKKHQTCLARAFPRLPTERAFIKPQLQELRSHGTFLIDSRELTIALGYAGRIDQKS
jgi:hypothetical protein